MTDIVFAHALDFKLTACGKTFTPGGIDNQYLGRFADAGFGQIFLVSRSSFCDLENLTEYEQLEAVNPYFLRKYSGGYGFLLSWRFYRDLFLKLQGDSLLIINYPSSTGIILILFAYVFRFAYVVEVASDSDTYREKRFGLLVQIISNLVGKVCIPRAIGALYVASFLQDKWNCDNKLVLSNVHIDDVIGQRSLRPTKKEYSITTVGAISYRKGVDVIIDEFAYLDPHLDITIELNIVGPVIDEGLKRRVDHTKMNNIKITQHGILRKNEVFQLLDKTDLYVQASRSEGLPRSVIEAMSRGVPVICSALPGVKGLVGERFQFSINRKRQLATLVKSLLNQPEILEEMSTISSETAKRFRVDVTRHKRLAFYQHCKQILNG